jgi:hypothetical protein
VRRFRANGPAAATVVEFCAYAALLAIDDSTILACHRSSPHEANLVNYIVRDGRTDESAMYMPAANGQPRGGAPRMRTHGVADRSILDRVVDDVARDYLAPPPGGPLGIVPDPFLIPLRSISFLVPLEKAYPLLPVSRSALVRGKPTSLSRSSSWAFVACYV